MLKAGGMPRPARTPVSFVVIVIVILVIVGGLWLGACGGQLAGVVRSQAAADLGCPEDQVEVTDLRSGNSVRDFSVTGCGRQEHYQAACNMTGGCQAYRPGEAALHPNHPVPASEALTVGADDLKPSDEPKPGEPERGDASTPAAEGGEQPRKVVAAGDEAASELPSAGTPSEPAATRLLPTEERTVTIRNNCSRRVVLYVGKQPGEGGRYMTLGSTNMTSPRLRLGDQVWLLDEREAGLASVSITGGADEIEIAENCAGLSAR